MAADLVPDENRAKLVTSGCLPTLVSLLNDDSVLPFVVPVLFNISVDYGRARLHAKLGSVYVD